MVNHQAEKAAILDKCCQSVECLARGKVFDLVGTLDLPQSSSQPNIASIIHELRVSGDATEEAWADTIESLKARMVKLERALTWIVNSPSAHPANMVKVAEEGLSHD